MTKELSYWEERITERLQSGMTIDEWCGKNGISKSKYFYWNRKVHKTQDSNSIEEFTLADVDPILTNDRTVQRISDSSPDFQVSLNNIQITVPNNFNPATLIRLLKVLKEL